MKSKSLYASRKSKPSEPINPTPVPSSDRASGTSPEPISSQDSSCSSSDDSSDDSDDQSDVEFVLGKRPTPRKTKATSSSSPKKRRKLTYSPKKQETNPNHDEDKNNDDDDHQLPPSSPVELVRSPSPVPSPTKPPVARLSSRVFPFLTPKPTSLTALPPPSSLRNKNKKTKKTPAKPTQTHLNFAGLLPSTTCSECGMSYCALNSSDISMHTRFHAKSTLGRDWTSPEWGALVWRESPLHDQSSTHNTQNNTNSLNNTHTSASSLLGSPRDRILRINAASKLPEKRAIQDLLLCVNTELSAPPENQTWRVGPAAAAAAYVYVTSSFPDSSKDTSSQLSPVPRAVAILVVERISRAHVLDLTTGTMTGYEAPGQTPLPVMGVSRIYTTRGFRRRGFAARLLDVATEDFIYRYRVPKQAVAWSQPSASGGKLAQSWHGNQSPGQNKVLVYLENDAITKK